MSDPSNNALPHQHLASKFLASLYAAGVTDFVVCPGSRNTPLTLTLLQMDTSANFPSLKIGVILMSEPQDILLLALLGLQEAQSR